MMVIMELGSAHTIITQRQSSRAVEEILRCTDIELLSRYIELTLDCSCRDKAARWPELIRTLYYYTAAHSFFISTSPSSEVRIHTRVPQCWHQYLWRVAATAVLGGRDDTLDIDTGSWLLKCKKVNGSQQMTNILDLLGVMFRRAKQQNI